MKSVYFAIAMLSITFASMSYASPSGELAMITQDAVGEVETFTNANNKSAADQNLEVAGGTSIYHFLSENIISNFDGLLDTIAQNHSEAPGGASNYDIVRDYLELWRA